MWSVLTVQVSFAAVYKTTSRYVTSQFPSICTRSASWDLLKPADIIGRLNHVRLFIEKTANGAFRYIEASNREWDVSYWAFLYSEFVSCHPEQYNGITVNSFMTIPDLKSVTVTGDNNIRISWQCDTLCVYGYRLYKTTDGSNWNLLMNESDLKKQSVEIPLTDSAAYYRVACVKNDSPAFTEGFWSNVLGYSKYILDKKYLVVHGF